MMKILMVMAVAVALGGCSDRQELLTGPPDGEALAGQRVSPTTVPVQTESSKAGSARLDMVRRGLEQGVDVNAADQEGRTVMMMAAFEGYSDVVQLLLDHGAMVDQRDNQGRSALMFAASGPFPATVELLLESGANPDLVDDNEGWSALMFSAAEGHQAVVEELLAHGARADLTDDDGDAAIDHARQREQAAIVRLLESLGPAQQ